MAIIMNRFKTIVCNKIHIQQKHFSIASKQRNELTWFPEMVATGGRVWLWHLQGFKEEG